MKDRWCQDRSLWSLLLGPVLLVRVPGPTRQKRTKEPQLLVTRVRGTTGGSRQEVDIHFVFFLLNRTIFGTDQEQLAPKPNPKNQSIKHFQLRKRNNDKKKTTKKRRDIERKKTKPKRFLCLLSNNKKKNRCDHLNSKLSLARIGRQFRPSFCINV